MEKPRNRTPMTLEVKQQILKLKESGETNSAIGRLLNIPRTTIVSVVKNKELIQNTLKTATPNTTTIRKRNGLIAEMETILTRWIVEELKTNITLTQLAIMHKAYVLFEQLKTERGDSVADATFSASRGWFQRFSKRSNLLQLMNATEDSFAQQEGISAELLVKEEKDESNQDGDDSNEKENGIELSIAPDSIPQTTWVTPLTRVKNDLSDQNYTWVDAESCYRKRTVDLSSDEEVEKKKLKSESCDLMFFKSVIPKIEPLTNKQKLELQVLILQKILEYTEENEKEDTS